LPDFSVINSDIKIQLIIKYVTFCSAEQYDVSYLK